MTATVQSLHTEFPGWEAEDLEEVLQCFDHDAQQSRAALLAWSREDEENFFDDEQKENDVHAKAGRAAAGPRLSGADPSSTSRSSWFSSLTGGTSSRSNDRLQQDSSFDPAGGGRADRRPEGSVRQDPQVDRSTTRGFTLTRNRESCSRVCPKRGGPARALQTGSYC